MNHQPDAALIVLAGGSGSRMANSMSDDGDNHTSDNHTSDDPGTDSSNSDSPNTDSAGTQDARVNKFNKVYLPLGGRDILEYCLATADRCPMLAQIVLVIRLGDEEHAAELLDRLNLNHPVHVTLGGSTRQGSEYAGLCHLRDDIESGEVGIVSIHDGARPFMSRDLLETTINIARHAGGAIPGLPLGENLYRVTSDLIQPLPTDELRRVQTPQTFQSQPLLEAYDQAAATGFQGVDTAETVERFTDLEVRVVPGDHRNIKVTFVEDMFVAEQYAGTWQPLTEVDQQP